MIVKESLSFERGIDPKRSMGIGREKKIDDFIEDFNSRIINRMGKIDKNTLNDVLYAACQNGNNEIVDLLLEEPNIDPEHNGNRCLKRACKDGNITIIKSLLNAGVNPARGYNLALTFASEEDHLDIVKLLLADKRVDPSYAKIPGSSDPFKGKDQIFNNTALHQAKNTVKYLIEDPRVNPSKAVGVIMKNHNTAFDLQDRKKELELAWWIFNHPKTRLSSYIRKRYMEYFRKFGITKIINDYDS